MQVQVLQAVLWGYSSIGRVLALRVRSYRFNSGYLQIYFFVFMVALVQKDKRLRVFLFYYFYCFIKKSQFFYFPFIQRFKFISTSYCLCSKIRNRCVFSFRARSVFSFFKVSRIFLRGTIRQEGMGGVFSCL